MKTRTPMVAAMPTFTYCSRSIVVLLRSSSALRTTRKLFTANVVLNNLLQVKLRIPLAKKHCLITKAAQRSTPSTSYGASTIKKTLWASATVKLCTPLRPVSSAFPPIKCRQKLVENLLWDTRQNDKKRNKDVHERYRKKCDWNQTAHKQKNLCDTGHNVLPLLFDKVRATL